MLISVVDMPRGTGNVPSTQDVSLQREGPILFDPCESRVLLSGNVAVKITDSHVRFIGDADSNALVITYSRPENQLVVTGADGTTIDGKSSRIYSARDNIAVSLGTGDDVVTLQRFSGGFNVGVDLGDGDDAVYFKRSNLLAADFFGGTGNDRLDVTDSTFSKRLRIFAGEQDDVTAMRAVRARQGLDITDTAGNTTVALQQVSASGESWFSGSNRRDALRIVDSDFTAFSAKLRDGNDGAYVRGTTFAQTSPIDGGPGTDDINREVIVSSDFADGELDGWYLQPSGSYPDFGDEMVSADEFSQTNRGTFEFAAIGAHLGLSGSVFRINHTGTASMVREITPNDGIEIDRAYIIRVSSKLVVGGDGVNGAFFVGAVGTSHDQVRVGSDFYGSNALISGGPSGSLVLREGVVAGIAADEMGVLKVFVASSYGDFTGTEVDFRSVKVSIVPA